jgi:hypothetical protein
MQTSQRGPSQRRQGLCDLLLFAAAAMTAVTLFGCGSHKQASAGANPAQAQAIIQQAQQNAAKQAAAYNNHSLPGSQPPAANRDMGHP